ncbi:MAG: type II secretion system protein [bacterium]|nr:type II secretion system protein [bacterium]
MKRSGFTLIELLLVIGIIAILASIVIVAINPTKQLADARDAQRRSDVNTVLNAVYQYAIDNKGNLPTGITTSALEICQTGGTCTGLLDLAVLTTNGTYLVSMPTDPSQTGADETDYTIVKNADGRVTVAAPSAENTTISVTR